VTGAVSPTGLFGSALIRWPTWLGHKERKSPHRPFCYAAFIHTRDYRDSQHNCRDILSGHCRLVFGADDEGTLKRNSNVRKVPSPACCDTEFFQAGRKTSRPSK